MINNNPWKTLSSKVMYENPWMSIREDAVLRPDDAQSATGFMAIITYITVSYLPLSVRDISFFSAFPKFAIIVVLNLSIYVIISRILKIEEVGPVLRRVKKIFFSKLKPQL